MTRKSSLIIILALAAAFAVAILALRQPDPQAVMRRAQDLLANEKTMHVDVTAKLMGQANQLGSALVADATSIDIVLHADLDRTNPQQPASMTTFEFKRQFDGQQGRLAGEARRKEGVYYLHLDSADGLAVIETEKMLGVWAKSGRPLTELLVPPGDEALAEHPLDAEGILAMRKALGAVNLFKVVEKLPAEKIEDQAMYHYAIETDVQSASALLMKLRQLRSSAPLTSDDILAVTGEILTWGKPVGEIWISKKDGRISKVSLQTGLRSAGGMEAGAVSTLSTFSRYGQPVDVIAPDAKDIETLLGTDFNRRLSLSGGRGPMATSPGEATSTLPVAPGEAAQAHDSDGDGLADGQEAFYSSDPWNPDTDGDGWTDGTEVDKGMNPLGAGTLFGFGL